MKRRSTIQGSMTSMRKRLDKLLAKTDGKFDHDNIKRLSVQRDHTDLEKLLESFKTIHQAYQHYGTVGKDEPEEESLVEKQEQYYDEVVDKVYQSLQLIADYEKSHKIYEAAQPDSDLAKKEAEEKAKKGSTCKATEE